MNVMNNKIVVRYAVAIDQGDRALHCVMKGLAIDPENVSGAVGDVFVGLEEVYHRMVSLPTAFCYEEKGSGMSGYVIGQIAQNHQTDYVIYFDNFAQWTAVSVDAPDLNMSIREWIENVVSNAGVAHKAEDLTNRVIELVDGVMAESFEEAQQIVKSLIEHLEECYLK